MTSQQPDSSRPRYIPTVGEQEAMNVFKVRVAVPSMSRAPKEECIAMYDAATALLMLANTDPAYVATTAQTAPVAKMT